MQNPSVPRLYGSCGQEERLLEIVDLDETMCIVAVVRYLKITVNEISRTILTARDVIIM